MHSVTIKFESVWDEFYREAIDLMLAGIDPSHPATVAEKDRNEVSMFEAWPMKFRNEARRYRPKGQRLLAATQWPAILGGSERQLAPAGALLITERELVLISEGKESATEPSPEDSSGEEPEEGVRDQEASPAPERLRKQFLPRPLWFWTSKRLRPILTDSRKTSTNLRKSSSLSLVFGWQTFR